MKPSLGIKPRCSLIIENWCDLYEKDGQFNEAIRFQDGLTVMLLLGSMELVNNLYRVSPPLQTRRQESQVLVAADTFRAGAVAQLAEWGRADVPVVTGPPEIRSCCTVLMEWNARRWNIDVLMIDTAGRLQNKDNLMAELEKSAGLSNVKNFDDRKPLLALDASTGQNALVQARIFKITPVMNCIDQDRWNSSRWGCSPCYSEKSWISQWSWLIRERLMTSDHSTQKTSSWEASWKAWIIVNRKRQIKLEGQFVFLYLWCYQKTTRRYFWPLGFRFQTHSAPYSCKEIIGCSWSHGSRLVFIESGAIIFGPCFSIRSINCHAKWRTSCSGCIGWVIVQTSKITFHKGSGEAPVAVALSCNQRKWCDAEFFSDLFSVDAQL